MARNGYFQLAAANNRTEVHIFPPVDGGKKLEISELTDYLGKRGYVFDLPTLNMAIESQEEKVVPLVAAVMPPERETYRFTISEDKMYAYVRFYAPSVGGEVTTYDEFMRDMRMRDICYGVKSETIKALYEQGQKEYCTDILVAEGEPPRHGTDAYIEYFFNTDLNVKPALNEDGSVDFFHLNTVCGCSKGEMLARIVPADEGDPGHNVYGNLIRPRNVKRVTLKYGMNIQLSEDKLSISSMVDGHVTLVDDKVFVSNILELENVDSSTGNIDYEGSVEVRGNIMANFEVRARGDIVVRGVVEGARLIAGGDIIIQRGANGMNKGVLASKGNVVSKFLENITVSAAGYVSSESILHSVV